MNTRIAFSSYGCTLLMKHEYAFDLITRTKRVIHVHGTAAGNTEDILNSERSDKFDNII